MMRGVWEMVWAEWVRWFSGGNGVAKGVAHLIFILNFFFLNFVLVLVF
jgi:hypothetical protein